MRLNQNNGAASSGNTTRKRFHLPVSGDKVTLAGVTICGDDIARRLHTRLAEHVTGILAKHGLQAFEMPKKAACIHEAGHAVVAAWLGKTVTSVRIYECPAGWAGFCDWDGEGWRLKPDDGPGLIELARNLYAGQAAEMMGREFREGSSLDELIVSQAAAALAAKSDEAAPALWQSEVHEAVVQCLRRNTDALANIGNYLWSHSKMKGQPLRDALAGVA
jgi:hypothetical protein